MKLLVVLRFTLVFNLQSYFAKQFELFFFSTRNYKSLLGLNLVGMFFESPLCPEQQVHKRRRKKIERVFIVGQRRFFWALVERKTILGRSKRVFEIEKAYEGPCNYVCDCCFRFFYGDAPGQQLQQSAAAKVKAASQVKADWFCTRCLLTSKLHIMPRFATSLQ